MFLGFGVDEFGFAADFVDPPGGGVERFFDDPVGFAEVCLRWGVGEGLTGYQVWCLGRLVVGGRLCVRGPHGLGKTTLNAVVVLWFALTRDARGVDWKIITTASAWRQLEKFLWPEVRKWAARVKWGEVGRGPFVQGELLRLGLRLVHGEALAVACEDPATIEGAHADSLLYVFDEAKTIPGGTFDAAEGAFSGAGVDTAQEAFALATSTPGLPSGRFFEIQSCGLGLEDWEVVHVTKGQVVEAGRMSLRWAEQKARQWGLDSAVYQNRVEGNFAAGEADGVIPLGWVEAAVSRWRLSEPPVGLVGLSSVGVDVAEEGGDESVLALRFGLRLDEVRRVPRGDVMEATGYVRQVLLGCEGEPPAVVDAIGLGAGVVARLREQGHRAVAFKASEGCSVRDRSGELEFRDCKAAAWWRVRDLLDPANGFRVELPPDDQLVGDLTAPRWRVGSSGKVEIESKDELKKRIGRSTDVGDAVVHAFWVGASGGVSPPVLLRRGSPRAEMSRRVDGRGGSRVEGRVGRLAGAMRRG